MSERQEKKKGRVIDLVAFRRRNAAKAKNNQQKPKKKKNRPQGQRQANSVGRRVLQRFPTGSRQGTGFAGRTTRKKMVVEEDEFIQDITVESFNELERTTWSINPGQAATFPWLSTIAKNYEKYRFLSLEFRYEPLVTQYGANNTGKVMFMADYDASDLLPTTKREFEDADPHSDGMPYQTLYLRLDPRQLHEQSVARFVRPGALPGGADIKTYDCANLALGTSGLSANGKVGEVRVHYVVELSIPIVENLDVGPPRNFRCLQFYDAATLLTGNGAWTPIVAAATDVNLGLYQYTPEGWGNAVQQGRRGVFLPPGNYLVNYSLDLNNIGATSLVFAAARWTFDGTVSGIRPGTASAAGVGQLTVSETFILRVSGEDQELYFEAYGGYTATTVKIDFVVTVVQM